MGDKKCMKIDVEHMFYPRIERVENFAISCISFDFQDE